MSDQIEKVMVEVPEPVVKTEAPKPTRDQVIKDRGWSAAEADAAEKRGLLGKAEEKPVPEPKPEPKVEKAEPEKQPEPVKEEPKATKPSGLPEFNLDAAQEAEFERIFGKGTAPHGIYHRMKSERMARQKAQAERDALKAEIDALKAGKSAQPAPETPVEDDDKPLTKKELLAIEEQRRVEYEKNLAEQHQRVSRVSEAQKAQEDYARTLYTDFDETVKLAADVMTNLDALITDKRRQNEVLELIEDLQRKAANADRFDLDQNHAAFVAYKIGLLHPNYGKAKAPPAAPKPNDGDSPKENPKANGGHTPEQLKRIEQNTQRRGSSAAVSGGSGKRLVSAEDVGLKDLAAMDAKKRLEFRTKHPERYAQLMNQ